MKTVLITSGLLFCMLIQGQYEWDTIWADTITIRPINIMGATETDAINMVKNINEARAHALYELVLLKGYLDHCNSDSVRVGWRYIEAETISEYGSKSIISEIYLYIDHPKFNYTHRITPSDYIRKEEIKEPSETPTFEGYVKWLSHILNQ